MSDARGTVVVLPQRPQIAGQEGARFNQQGMSLPARPVPPSVTQDSEIAIDTGTGTAVRISHGGDFDLAAPAMPAPAIRRNPEPPPFNENLAVTLDFPESTLGTIGALGVQGVDADIASRQQWIDQYNKGIDLLGLKIEEIAARGSRRNVSRVGHPLMIEAMVKYQAGAAAEMLPAMGPVKVPTIGKVPDQIKQLANNFEDDFNYFLTEVAREYYPDTRRMLMHQAFCGIGYKKVYRCPIRRRPVSESVLAPDLIVSEEATDLDNALRVTHRIDMLKSQLKRMQIVGQYRDIELGSPGLLMGFGQSAQRKIKESEGISIVGFGRPEDQPYEILEIDMDLDVDEHMIDGYWERRTPDGLPLPYKVTVERNSQQVLSIRRNWRPSDKLCLKRNMYVKFGLVPGLGYHDWGFLQLLGNQTRALRAVWRLLIDAGMFSLFPGGIKNKNIRMSTNEIAPGPGEFIDVDAPITADLTKQWVPMPYKDLSANLVQFSEIVKADGQKLGGTAVMDVGEGRANVPVGTIMAFVEDKVQIMSDVYKNNHLSQKEELRKLRDLFAENPADLWLLTRDRPVDPDAQRHQWERAEEFTNMALQPASDPNVPSRIHRLMVDNVMAMLAQQAPQFVDTPSVLTDIFTDIGKDPDRYVVRQQPGQQPPDPRVQAKMIEAQTKQQEAITDAQTADKKIQLEREKLAVQAAGSAAQNETMRHVEQIKQDGAIAQLHHSAALAPEGGTTTE